MKHEHIVWLPPVAVLRCTGNGKVKELFGRSTRGSMTLKDICEEAGKRSGNEWCALFSEYRIKTRSWIQAHGELAALAGFFAGILIVLFFRIFAWIAFIIFIVFSIFWLKSPES